MTDTLALGLRLLGSGSNIPPDFLQSLETFLPPGRKVNVEAFVEDSSFSLHVTRA